MFIFMLILVYCDAKAAMLTKNFPYNPNNFQPVKQSPKIFQVVQKLSKLSRDFHTDQKIQTVRRLSKLSGDSPDILVEFQRQNFPDMQKLFVYG